MIRRQTKRDPKITPGQHLLDPIPAPTVAALLAFADFLADLNVDYIILMARKAVRLYDLLLAAGCRRPSAFVMSDHVLDQSLAPLRGKRVALVDDTLIVGTTIAETEERLRDAGVAELKKIVFAVDKGNWVRELAQLDRYFVEYDEPEMLTFCINEVNAFAEAALPYITDFPVSASIKLHHTELSVIYSLPGWSNLSLTSIRQEPIGVFYYTHLPLEDYLGNLSDTISKMIDVIDIVKVRSFIYSGKLSYIAKIIPFVTLHPLSEVRVKELFSSLIHDIPMSREQRESTLEHLNTPKAMLRFIQYFLALIVGEKFLSDVKAAGIKKQLLHFDLGEAVRLFGPWLRLELEAAHNAASQIARGSVSSATAGQIVQPDPLPGEVARLADNDFALFFGAAEASSEASRDGRDNLADFMRIFTGLHEQYELPARREAKRLGRGVLSASADEAPFRDRLKIGLPWDSIARLFSKWEGVTHRPARSRLLSVMLDAMVDLGVVVPFLCQRDGVLFRAYRHGELGPFADQEYVLAYCVAEGFLKGNGRSEIPRLTLEKLLVALLRIGAARGFLTPIMGLNGSEQLAHIAFHKHGAVATLSEEQFVFADSRYSWLSTRLVKTGVLRRSGEKLQYSLGNKPNAGLVTPTAPQDASQLGYLLGKLCRAPGSGRRPVLNENDLAVLTTCCRPQDTAGAVVAELRLFNNWFTDNYIQLTGFDISSAAACAEALSGWPRGDGYGAMNSARLKLTGYWEGRPQKLVEAGAAYLASQPNGEFQAEYWSNLWKQVVTEGDRHQIDTFSPWIETLGRDFLTIAIGMFTIELALAGRAAAAGIASSQTYSERCAKVAAYLRSLKDVVEVDGHAANAMEHLLTRASNEEMFPDLEQAYVFGLNLISKRQHMAQATVFQTADLVRTYGQKKGRIDYDHALWYDIVNSTGQRSSLTGHDLAEYRKRVDKFKHDVNVLMFGLTREAQRRGVYIACPPGTLDSKDDEKHLFFSGEGSFEKLKEAIELIQRTARLAGLGLRMLAINGDFAGYPPQSYIGDPNIVGSAFWEYGSRVRDGLKKLEPELSEKGQLVLPYSMFWLGGAFAKMAEEFAVVGWSGEIVSDEIRVTMDDRPVRVSYIGGPVYVTSARGAGEPPVFN